MSTLVLHRPSDGYITQGFGADQKQGDLHAGTDFAYTDGVQIFDKVYAAAAGRVIWAGDSRNLPWPNVLYLNIDFNRNDNIDHSAGNYTVIAHFDEFGNQIALTGYGHQEAIYVRAGDWVEARQHIGKVGDTGFNFGKHLHFDLVLAPFDVDDYPFYGRVDPTPYFVEEGEFTVAEVKQILDAIKASEERIMNQVTGLLLTGYKYGGRDDNPGLILHTLEVIRLVKAIPTAVWWGTTVMRDGQKVPALQELANAVTMQNNGEEALLDIKESVSADAFVPMIAEAFSSEEIAELLSKQSAEEIVNALINRFATLKTDAQPSA